LFSGYDLGDAPQLTYGDSDYEYWLRIAAVDKDQVLLALIEKLYSGNLLVISKFKEYLDTMAIPNQFYSF